MIRPFQTRPTPRRAFTLVEMMIVVLVIGILLAIAVPGFINARETGRAKACVANLFQINSGKLQCVMDNKLSATSTATFSVDGVTSTTGSPNYIRTVPVCPSGGAYATGTVSTAPTCSVSTDPTAAVDYQVGGHWYHGY